MLMGMVFLYFSLVCEKIIKLFEAGEKGAS